MPEPVAPAPTTPAATGPETAAPAAPNPAEPPTDGGAPQNTDGDDLSALDPATLAGMVRDLRKENASSRTNAKATAATEAEQALTQKLGKALGLVKDDAQLDPAQLTEKLTSAQKEATTLKTERAAERAARKIGLDGDALLDSRSFAGKLGKLDPTGENFTSELDALVKEYANDSRYKTSGPAPARSGGDFSGGSGDATKSDLGSLSVEDYIAKTRKKKG